ncbi:unnamed protein product [Callosobruchus maculatus]|uniref:CCHC-type domain-containing protein n=1 Tax=Callosobruchus maculatus TaxID=64391 RepID=A0A653DFC5_CALMS|nr:unnamed protein product [Callosobruchus maculatus]
MKVTGVNRGYTDEEFLDELFNQNPSVRTELTEEEAKSIKIVGKRPCRNARRETWFLEAEPAAFKKMVKRGTLYFDLETVFVEEHVEALMCFKCCRFGHVAKHCQEANMTCYTCGVDYKKGLGTHSKVKTVSEGSKECPHDGDIIDFKSFKEIVGTDGLSSNILEEILGKVYKAFKPISPVPTYSDGIVLENDAPCLSNIPPVGLLTGWKRSLWAEAREDLMKDDKNKRNLELITKSLLVVCLDEALPSTFNCRLQRGGKGHTAGIRDETNLFHQMLHGGGVAFNSSNRWFDKTIQLIISGDGACGLCYEHSNAEGVAVIQLVEKLWSHADSLAHNSEVPASSHLPPPEKLEWILEPSDRQRMEDAGQVLDNLIKDLDFQQEYTSVHAFVEQKIAQADSVAIMCDGWSNIRNESIVNFILTTPTPILYKILATGKESLTAEYITRQIQEVIDKIGVQKVFGVVTDNAANMNGAWFLLKKEAESGNFNHFAYGCVAHSLNLIFSDMKKLHSVQTFLTQVVSLVKTVRQSHLVLAAFKEKQGKGNGISLKLPMATRWGYLVYCLESVQANKHAIMSLAIEENLQDLIKKHPDFKKNVLDDTFLDKVEGFISLFKPIATAITFFESDKTRISLVVKVFKQLEEHFLKALPACPLLKQEEAKAAEIIRHRREFAVSDVHRVCNLLDPSTEGGDLTPCEQTDAIETIFETAKRCPNVDERIVLTDLANFQAGFFSKSFLWTAVSEVPPTTWWKGFCNSTELSKSAYKFLELPASSAPCERSFSTYEGVHTPKRNRLNNERAAKLVYTKHNLKLNCEIDSEGTATTARTSTTISLASTSGCAVSAPTLAKEMMTSYDSDSDETMSSSNYSLHDTEYSDEDPED